MASEEEAKKKWEDQLQDFSGKTMKQRDEEINQTWQDQLKLKAAIDIKMYKKLKSRKQAIRNRSTIDDTNQLDLKRVPIDGDVKEGSRVFMMQCASCHSLETVLKNFQKGSGPSLALIYNKPAASNRQFDNYTQPLLRSKIVWNSWNLFKWIQNPQLLVNSTSCMKGTGGILDLEERYGFIVIIRTDLVQFLKQFSKTMNTYVRREIGRNIGSENRDYNQYGYEKALEVYKLNMRDTILKEEKEEEEIKIAKREEEAFKPIKQGRVLDD